jgi:hypothetical protein
MPKCKLLMETESCNTAHCKSLLIKVDNCKCPPLLKAPLLIIEKLKTKYSPNDRFLIKIFIKNHQF